MRKSTSLLDPYGMGSSLSPGGDVAISIQVYVEGHEPLARQRNADHSDPFKYELYTRWRSWIPFSLNALLKGGYRLGWLRPKPQYEPPNSLSLGPDRSR